MSYFLKRFALHKLLAQGHVFPTQNLILCRKRLYRLGSRDDTSQNRIYLLF